MDNNSNNIKIYRRRLIPDECVLLGDDIVLEVNEDVIVTKWHTLKPRRDFDHGYSCYYLKLGYKVSKFYRADNTLLYWYCDVVNYRFEDEGRTLIATDLLVDVVVYPDGDVRVLDANELAIALDKGLCDTSLVSEALIKLDKLLNFIYDDKFDVLCDKVERWSCC